ncbi:MAG: cytidylate kinase-like family protein [Clostridiales bacterium]|nr:cytidylate kinase-like family protein [Clostridiales bacterium]
MSNKIITISREFGSGGRTIGRNTADALNINCYDSELIETAAEESGFAKEFISDRGEYVNFGARLASSLNTGRRNYDSPQDCLWKAQKKIILDLAERESCVIVGRCADYILRDKAGCLNVFIHSDIKNRAKRIVEVYGESDRTPEKRIKEKDRHRKAYFRYYTDMEWGDVHNYHIALDSGFLGIDECVRILKELYFKLP